MGSRRNDFARLEACLEDLVYRDRAAKWALDALTILERLNVTRGPEPRNFSKVDRHESMARCHVMLGKEAFLRAEKRFWKSAQAHDGPDMSCRIERESAFFAPATKAMSAKRPSRSKRPADVRDDYDDAVHHFERANALLPDRWDKKTPRNVRLTTKLSCDPCLPSFYLGVIALRRGSAGRARAFFARVTRAPKIRGRHTLLVAAAVFEAAAFGLEGDLAGADKAAKRALRLDRQNINARKARAYACEQQGKHEEAITWYRDALDWDPNDAFALRRLAAIDDAPRIGLRKPTAVGIGTAETPRRSRP